MNQAEIDSEKILNYLELHGGKCSVQDMIENSDAEKLRVYPLIFRLSIDGRIKISEFDSWGTPLVVETV